MSAADLIDDDDDDEYHQVHVTQPHRTVEITGVGMPFPSCVAIAEESAMQRALAKGMTIGIVESSYPFIALYVRSARGEVKRTSVSRHTTPDDFRRQCDGAWKFLEQQHRIAENRRWLSCSVCGGFSEHDASCSVLQQPASIVIYDETYPQEYAEQNRRLAAKSKQHLMTHDRQVKP